MFSSSLLLSTRRGHLPDLRNAFATRAVRRKTRRDAKEEKEEEQN